MSLALNEYILDDIINITSNKVDTKNLVLQQYISTENMLPDRKGICLAASMPSGKVNQFLKNDTLFSNIRTYFRKVWFASFDGGSSPDVLIFRTKDVEVLDPRFLYYLISDQKFIDYSDKTSKGAKMPRGDKSAILNYKTYLPTLSVQKRISKILSDLDDKIYLNNQTNQILESIAQAIFKSWFIDFDPVRAKISAKQEGKDPELAAMCAISGKSEEELQQMSEDDFAELQATAALFPDELVESELGEVPRGWGVGCVGDEVSTISKTYPLKQVEEVIFLNTGDILEGKFLHANKSRTESLPGQAKKSIQKDDILYSEIRPQNKRFAYIHFDAEDYVVSTKLMVLRKKSTIPSHFVYFILSRQSTIDFLQVMAESRSGTFPQITFDVLSKVEYLKPNNNALIDIFTRKVLSPFFDKKVMNETENNKLIGVRDNLLPKLLSGEVDVSGLQIEVA